MSGRYRKYILFLLLIFFSGRPLSACRFNVRETGFVIFNGERYILIGYTDKNTSSEISGIFRSTVQKMLSGSNVFFELINIHKQADHPAIKLLKENNIGILPSLILVSPDSQTLVFPLKRGKQDFKKSLIKAINKILYSPARQTLQEQLINAYGVILLIEGTDKSKNTAALHTAQEALNHIIKKMDLMPKAIKNPPVIFSLPYGNRSRETVLFWALGLDAKNESAYAAVLYGKARWMGPLFRDDEITKQNLSEILYIVGADCECGLDKNWLRGTALPMMWTKKHSKRIAENLGFDPENPLTKIEISQIMRLGRYSDNVYLKHPSSTFNRNPVDTRHVSAETLTTTAPPFNDNRLDSLKQVEKQTIKTSILITFSILGFLLMTGFIIIRKHHNKL